MSPVIGLLIFIGFVVVVVGLVSLVILRVPGTPARRERRGRDMERVLALRALTSIREKADQYSDLDSVLATEIRTIMTTFEQDRLKNQ